MSASEFTNPGEPAIEALLRAARTIAVVGLSPNAARPSYHVAAALQGFGYRIIPVRPATESVLGERAYARLEDVPVAIDVVEVFRAPEHVDPVVDACLVLRDRARAAGAAPWPWALWLQDGVVNAPAAQRAHAAGLEVVMDRCMYRDYLRLFGPRPGAGRG